MRVSSVCFLGVSVFVCVCGCCVCLCCVWCGVVCVCVMYLGGLSVVCEVCVFI